MMTWLWISAGAVAGANLRFAVNNWVAAQLPGFPAGTLIVNVTGALLLGLFAGWAASRPSADPRLHLLFAVGFCGAYTTFSAYSREVVELLAAARWLGAASCIAANNLLAIAAFAGGTVLARALLIE
jgi:CrcB protein